MYEEFFSRRLAQLRAQKGVSAREMSLAIGQNSSYINRIENQRAFPSMQGFFYICEYLGVTPGAFFAASDPAGGPGPEALPPHPPAPGPGGGAGGPAPHPAMTREKHTPGLPPVRRAGGALRFGVIPGW